MWQQYYPLLVWNGAGYGLVWNDNRSGNHQAEVFFARLDRNGVKVGLDVRVTFNLSNKMIWSMTWTGSEYGLVWDDDRTGRQEVFFARLDPDGVKIFADRQLSNDDSANSFDSVVPFGAAKPGSRPHHCACTIVPGTPSRQGVASAGDLRGHRRRGRLFGAGGRRQNRATGPGPIPRGSGRMVLPPESPEVFLGGRNVR